MELNCEGCAGCCIDWRALAPETVAPERRGPRPPVDDAYNLVALTREEIRGLLAAGLADAMVPRLWHADADDGAVEIDGHRLAAIDGRPAFFVGLRKPPKPVAPFGAARTWLPTCVFLDPETLQCRIYDDPLFPAECDDYPGHNLVLDTETECERVEAAGGGQRLLEATPPADTDGLLLGPQALGTKLFVHPEPERLAGVVDRAAAGELTPADRAAFVGVAAASSPGTLDVDAERAREARERALEATSWVTEAVAEWHARASPVGTEATDVPSDVGAVVEDDRGAPTTPGWD